MASNWENLQTYCGSYSSECEKIKTCYRCKKEYKVYSGQLEWRIHLNRHKKGSKNLHFCSYNCKYKFINEHPELFEDKE